MRPQEIIALKRDGGVLSDELVELFINGVCDGSWADYQTAALLMAMFVRGLNNDEQDALTRRMLYSGKVLDFSDIDAPKADKHSTGGVGDKTSLIIAPLVASCGVSVPMISGRGLGHTGGTLDKLESIPGYNVNLSTDELRKAVKECGFAMAGQTSDIAPADKKLYALRDATATVAHIPLIVASIMSKKLAEGLDALVLDVKSGSGAFTQGCDDARNLARALVETGKKFSVNTEALISDMSQPLGTYIGNAHEVYECIKILRDETEPGMEPTRELSLDLSARILMLAGLESDLSSARRTLETKLVSGEALERFRRNIEIQNGKAAVCDVPHALLASDLVEQVVTAPAEGFVTEIDTLCIGNALVEAGGGRTRAEDAIDHGVGFKSRVSIGQEIREGEPLCVAFCRTARQADEIGKMLEGAYTIGVRFKNAVPELVKEIVR